MFLVLLVARQSGATSAVTNTSLTASSLLIGTTSSYFYSFYATSGLPIGGTVSVTYPTGFDLTNAIKTQYNNVFTIKNVVGQTITYNALTATNAGAMVYDWSTQTDGIVNPTTPGIYSIQISTSNDPTPMLMPVTLT
jgi:hypothetical protein